MCATPALVIIMKYWMSVTTQKCCTKLSNILKISCHQERKNRYHLFWWMSQKKSIKFAKQIVTIKYSWEKNGIVMDHATYRLIVLLNKWNKSKMQEKVRKRVGMRKDRMNVNSFMRKHKRPFFYFHEYTTKNTTTKKISWISLFIESKWIYLQKHLPLSPVSIH